MDLIKAANFNAVRATIFPPHTEALDRADQIGLYFEDEGPACWGKFDDLRAAPVYMGIMAEFVARDRNHPCVIDWSICNESRFGPVFALSRALVKQLDPTRICSATWGDSSLDVETWHHPVTLQRIQEGLVLQRYSCSRASIRLADGSCEFERAHRGALHGCPDGFGDPAGFDHGSPRV